MKKLRMSYLMTAFVFYSIIGWLGETIYCSVGKRKLVKRGFLNGPYCPIYGVGALLILLLTAPFSYSPWLVFMIAVLAASALEYFTSWLFEKHFGVLLWDYSYRKIQINGRVCLVNSLLFGVAGLFLNYCLAPWLQTVLLAISPDSQMILAATLAIIFGLDCLISFGRLNTAQQALN